MSEIKKIEVEVEEYRGLKISYSKLRHFPAYEYEFTNAQDVVDGFSSVEEARTEAHKAIDGIFAKNNDKILGTENTLEFEDWELERELERAVDEATMDIMSPERAIEILIQSMDVASQRQALSRILAEIQEPEEDEKAPWCPSCEMGIVDSVAAHEEGCPMLDIERADYHDQMDDEHNQPGPELGVDYYSRCALCMAVTQSGKVIHEKECPSLSAGELEPSTQKGTPCPYCGAEFIAGVQIHIANCKTGREADNLTDEELDIV